MKLRKYVLIGLLVFALSSSICYADTLPVQVIHVNSILASSGNDAATGFGNVYADSDIIRWRYKTKDGKMYKRKYNYTKRAWIGEWIRLK